MGAASTRVITQFLALAIFLAPASVWAQTDPPLASATPAPAETETAVPPTQIVVSAPQTEPPAPAPVLQAEQLDRLLAPIALYPDALLAQILMAATYPLDVVKATRWILDPRQEALSADQLGAAVEAETWDPSVKAL